MNQSIISKGLAAAGTSKIVYQIDGNIYKELRVVAGVHSKMEPEKTAVFEVYLDQSGDKVSFKTKKLTPKDPAYEFVMPIERDCKTIILLTESLPYTHIVWADPVLIKRDEMSTDFNRRDNYVK